MNKTRLEAFSDGVIAIIITIMVLELKVPHDPSWPALHALWPVLFSYVLSFVYVGIYWVNHHHILHLLKRVDGAVLWANLHLLFWLSLIPFTTAFMGENHFAAVPTFAYGFVMFMSGLAYTLLLKAIRRVSGQKNMLGDNVKPDHKGNVSLLCYALAMGASFYSVWVAQALYILVAMMWFIPDRRIEQLTNNTSAN